MKKPRLFAGAGLGMSELALSPACSVLMPPEDGKMLRNCGANSTGRAEDHAKGERSHQPS
jgi:hypothetical protein